MKYSTATWLFLIPTLAFARLGETEAKCVERYGVAAEGFEQKDTKLFYKSDFVITTHFFDGKVDCIIYSKEKKDDARPDGFSDTEISELLKINGGSEWESHSTNPLIKTWLSKDGLFVASYRATKDPCVLVMTKAYAERRRQEKKAEEGARLKGL